jgi:hypothetical protein
MWQQIVGEKKNEKIIRVSVSHELLSSQEEICLEGFWYLGIFFKEKWKRNPIKKEIVWVLHIQFLNELLNPSWWKEVLTGGGYRGVHILQF